MKRAVILFALVFSGLTALVYQILWTRLLGFAFGTTTEAISIVLAVFFGGLALGNLAAVRWMARVERPLAVYARLEAAIGAYALLSLPALRHLDSVFGWIGVPETDAGLVFVRMLGAALLLLPPTLAMGATLPLVARAFLVDDARIGRGSGQLYAANTLGAVLGAYGCGFWLIPELGLTHSILLAGLVNLAVAAVISQIAGPRIAAEPAVPARSSPPLGRRAVFLACFGVSGFVAIGYEIVWSKIFGIVMEGTLYGFAAVLSAFLLGVGLGSLAISSRVDRLRDLPRAFALLHVAIGVAVAMGAAAVPYLPYLYQQLAAHSQAGDAVHLLYALVLPIVLAPTALFGAAFPILIRLDAGSAKTAGHSVGLATAINTAGSITASLLVGFWWIPAIGMDGSLYALLMIDFAAALLLLCGFQESRGTSRIFTLAGSAAVVGTIALSFGGVHVEQAIAGRQLDAKDFGAYVKGLERDAANRTITIEGRSSLVSVYATESARLLRTNGLPEAGVRYAQPYAPLESVMLGIWPYLLADTPNHALVIGLGGGNTLDALLRTGVTRIDVVELEKGVLRAVELLHEGRPNPLANPRVSLRVGDGRNDLLLRHYRKAPGYDLISSQPSHPWRIGAANLFTEEFFQLARASLREGGVFASWLNGFRIDAESLLSVFSSFERVFEGSLVIDVSHTGRGAFLLVGSTRPIELDTRRLAERLAEPRLAAFLAPYEKGDVDVLLSRVEGPGHVFAAIDPAAANTDDNAFVETRTPRQLTWQVLDFDAIEARLSPQAPLLPALRGPFDPLEVADALFTREAKQGWPYRRALERLLAQFADAIPDWEAGLLRARADLRDPSREARGTQALRALAAEESSRPEPLRALGEHLARRRSAWRDAAAAFAGAFERSELARDAYDAGRATHPIDRDAAWVWFERIPAPERSEYPRLAYYAARRALDRDADRSEVAALYRDLLRWLESEPGRNYPGGHEVASRIAWRLGDEVAARAHADADARQRADRARPHLDAAATALEDERLDDARAALGLAARDVPGESRLALLEADLAIALRRPADVERALGRVRRYAGSLEEANVAENHFRSRHGLPLRSE